MRKPGTHIEQILPAKEHILRDLQSAYVVGSEASLPEKELTNVAQAIRT